MPGSTALRRMHDAEHVEIEQALELRRLGLAEGRGFGRAGIGDQDIERSARGFGGLDAGLDRGRVGDIGDDDSRRHGPPPTASSSAAFCRPSTVTVAPAAGQGRGHGAADAAAAAGDQCMPPGKRCHLPIQ